MEAIARIVVLGVGAAALAPLGLLLHSKDEAGVARKLTEWAPGQELDTPLAIVLTGALLVGFGLMYLSALHQGARGALLVCAFVQLGVGAAAGGLVATGVGSKGLTFIALQDTALGLTSMLHTSLNVLAAIIGLCVVVFFGIGLLVDPVFVTTTFNSLVYANVLKMAPELVEKAGIEKMPAFAGKGPLAFHCLLMVMAAQGLTCVLTALFLGPRGLRTLGKLFVAQAAALGGLVGAEKASLEIAGGLAGGLGAAGLLLLLLVPKAAKADAKQKTA